MSRMWGTGSIGPTAAVAALTAVVMTGCSSVESCPAIASAAAASCAPAVEYQGRLYIQWSAELPVAKGRLLGRAVYPPCNDTGGSCELPDGTGQPTQVWAVRGVDPDRVVVARRQGSKELAVFGRLKTNPGKYFRFSDGTWHVRDGHARNQ